MAQLMRGRLARALRACARYREENTRLRTEAAVNRICFDALATRYWEALGYGPDTLARLDPSYVEEEPK